MLKAKNRPDFTITTRVSIAENKKLEALSKKYGLSKSEVLRQIIEQYLTKEEK